jgi:preprotein translocase subunit SecE
VRRKFAIFSKIYGFLNSIIMNKIANYFKESYLELQEKVTWPTWANLQQSTVIVLVATIIITALVWVMDFSGAQLLKLIYSLLK